MHLAYPAVLAVLLFCVGLYGVLARRNAILVLMSVELMLNAVNLNLVAFDVWLRDSLHAGQALTLFTIAIAAAEIGIGLAIVLRCTATEAPPTSTGSATPPKARTTGARPAPDGPDRPPPPTRAEGGGRRVTTTTLAVLVPLLPFLGAVAGLLLGRRAPGFVRPLAVLPTLAAVALAVAVAVRPGRRQDATGRRDPADPDRLRSRSTSPCISTGSRRSSPSSSASSPPACSSTRRAICATTPATPPTPRSSRCSPPRCCSSSTPATSSCCWSAGRSWASARTSSSATTGRPPRRAPPPSRRSWSPSWVTSPSSSACSRWPPTPGRSGSPASCRPPLTGGLGHPTLIALLLLAGVAGKSAQFPLHTWLPDAMAGPTPVSALIHAATMVAAGIYFVARLLPVFAASAAALAVLAVMAAITMVGSALAALAQDDIKRVLAYSTIGQLGYMTGALAVGDRGAAVFHLLSHGAFKALLFLGAGVLIHAAGTNSLAAMSRMGGLARRIPDAYWTMTVALLALAAIPPFAGFFSKEAVLVRRRAHRARRAPTSPPSGAGLDRAARRSAHRPPHRRLRHPPVAARLPGPGRRGPGLPTTIEQGRPGAAGRHEHRAVGARRAHPRASDSPRHSPTGSTGAPSRPALTTSVLATGRRARRRSGHLRPPGATPRRSPPAPRWAPSPPTPRPAPAWSRRRPSPATPRSTASIAAAPDPADPGRLLLGPLHRHAANGFHLDAVYYRPVRPPGPRGGRAWSASLTAKSSRPTYAARAPGHAGSAGPCAARRTAMCRRYLGALLAGSLVLAAAAVVLANVTSGS